MAGVFKLEITETAEQLKTRLHEQKAVFGKERVQALYLLKLGQVKTIQQLAVVMGRDRTTVQRWLLMYRQGGRAPAPTKSGESWSPAGHSGMGSNSFK